MVVQTQPVEPAVLAAVAMANRMAVVPVPLEQPTLEAVGVVVIHLQAQQAALASSSLVTQCLAQQYLPLLRQNLGLLQLVR